MDLQEHIADYFEGHILEDVCWDEEASEAGSEGIVVTAISPGPQSELWTYVSRGASSRGFNAKRRLEFVIQAEEPDPRLVELVGMSCQYHHAEGLAVGFTFPVGEPVLPESQLDHILVSIPYQFDEEFEDCGEGDDLVQYVWLLPITREEREFKVKEGLEALEQLFEDAEVPYWDAWRDSVTASA